MRKKVIVGLSGGVDSAVAALLLKEQGYEVTGIFMKNWDEQDDDGACTAEQDYQDAVKIAEQIGIDHYAVNFEKEYEERVFSYFLEEYRKGRTPNPDILCNKEIKFKAFLDYVFALGADYIATGHYCRTAHYGGRTALLRGRDPNKDQSYFLCQLTEKQIERVLFPVGEYLKTEVRDIAVKNGLVNAHKKDSTGICFIGERKFNAFLEKFLPSQGGDIVSDRGVVLGRHHGLMYHTIGQRKGLGIGGQGEPWFVYGKDIEKNQLLVCQGAEHPLLFSDRLIADQVSFVWEDQPLKKFNLTAKFRYRQSDIPVRGEVFANGDMVLYYDHIKAVTPGQAAVLYDGERLVGSAIIREVYRGDERLLL